MRFLQIAPVSRGDVSQYRTLRRELDELVGTIDGEYADFDWTPLRYLNKSFNHRILTGFYRAARIGLVSRIHPPDGLLAAALALGHTIASRPPIAAQCDHGSLRRNAKLSA